MASKLDLVGVEEIAARLGVSRQAVTAWQRRSWPSGRGGTTVKPPKLLGIVSGRVAVYDWPDVERWARATGRLTSDR
jgi:hypothetical protein